MDFRVGIIGAGNMGSAIINGIIASGFIDENKCYIYDTDKRKTANIKKNYRSVNIANENNELISNSEIIIIAIKPNSIASLLAEHSHMFVSGKILVSIAVGVPISFYKKLLGQNIKIIRAMPNTPVLVSEGVTLLSTDDNIDNNSKALVENLFKALGQIQWLNEELLTNITGITGSSPAYVFMFIEAMAEAGILLGLTPQMAFNLSAQTILGSAKMLIDTGIHPAQLKNQVCSPTGTTIEAVVNLEKNGFRYSIIEAILECAKKAQTIEAQFACKTKYD